MSWIGRLSGEPLEMASCASKRGTDNQQDRFTTLGELRSKGTRRGGLADTTLTTWRGGQGSGWLCTGRVAGNKPQKIHFKVFWSRMFCRVGGRATISSAMIVVGGQTQGMSDTVISFRGSSHPETHLPRNRKTRLIDTLNSTFTCKRTAQRLWLAI